MFYYWLGWLFIHIRTVSSSLEWGFFQYWIIICLSLYVLDKPRGVFFMDVITHWLKLVHLCKGWQTLNKANSFSEGHIYWNFSLLIALELDCFHSYILCLSVCISLSAGSTFSIFRASVYPLTETFQMLLDLVNIVC